MADPWTVQSRLRINLNILKCKSAWLMATILSLFICINLTIVKLRFLFSLYLIFNLDILLSF